MNRVDVDLGRTSYPILIETSSLPNLGKVIRGEIGQARCVVITDENVDELYGSTLIDSLREEGLRAEKLVVEPGESSKSVDKAETLYEKLAKLNLHRDSTVLAFGGGVVGDLAGFVGSTFLRGLSVIQVPTTLLAQVDSSVGGKTAVNLSRGKNLVGTFHQPEMVAIDPAVLNTLAPADVRSGLGEILKYGLIWDEEFFWKTASNLESLEEIEDPEELESTISRCCEIKSGVVSRDEMDEGIRRILNFGHTIGHGIEAGSGYGEVKHGEAVIWGMIGELWISLNRGYLDRETFYDLVRALNRLSLPPLPTDLTDSDLLGYIGRDKKVRDGIINSVLIKEPGRDVVVEEIDETEIMGAWEFLRESEVRWQ